MARALERLGIIVVLNYAIGPYRFDLVHVGARTESDWDRLPCWELYDDLHWEHEESYAREMGLLRPE